MSPKERFISALERKPLSGRVPHFELVFFLTMEEFGKVHPSHRLYSQWDQMSKKEKELHIKEMAEIFVMTADRFEHSAIFLQSVPGGIDGTLRMIDAVGELAGDKYFLMMHGDATFSLPSGEEMLNFSYRIQDEPQKLKTEAEMMVNSALTRAEKLKKRLDGFALCCDYCLNTGPFLSPNQFSEFVAPYLAQSIAAYRDMGFYTIKHTDGNIMPIIDQLVQANPHALHSIDPQAGVDIAEVKRLYGNDICLIGNVNCGLMQTGTDEQVVESVRYALKHGMPGGGYIFSTSNCIYTGMPLDRYELILDIWKNEGNYD